MKPFKYSLFLALFLLFLAHISFGQSLTAFRAYNNSTITLKTGIGSITPSNVGGNIDSVCRYLSIWDLQQITNIGARTNNVVAFGRTSSTQTVIDSNGVRNSNNTNLLWQFTNISGKPTWLMGGAEHTYYGIIQPDTFNTLHSWGLRNVSGKFLFDIDTSTFVASKHKLDSVAGLAVTVDTMQISTRKWRQKGIDSIVGLSSSGIQIVAQGSALSCSLITTYSLGTYTPASDGMYRLDASFFLRSAVSGVNWIMQVQYRDVDNNSIATYLNYTIPDAGGISTATYKTWLYSSSGTGNYFWNPLIIYAKGGQTISITLSTGGTGAYNADAHGIIEKLN